MVGGTVLFGWSAVQNCFPLQSPLFLVGGLSPHAGPKPCELPVATLLHLTGSLGEFGQHFRVHIADLGDAILRWMPTDPKTPGQIRRKTAW